VAPWLLSYDDAPEVRALYGNLDLRARTIDSTYSTHPIGGSSFVGRELFYTNLARLPAPRPASAEHEGLSVLNGNNNKITGDGPVRRPHSMGAHRTHGATREKLDEHRCEPDHGGRQPARQAA
jgi:DNA adenine methylase